MLVHELCRVVDVLNGVERLRFFEDDGGRHALGSGELGHGVGFDEVVVSCGSGHDDAGSDAGFVFADAFQYSLALFRRWCAVGFGGSAEDDDGVEMSLSGIVGRESRIVDYDDQEEDENQCREGRENSGRELHRPRVAEISVDRAG